MDDWTKELTRSSIHLAVPMVFPIDLIAGALVGLWLMHKRLEAK